MFALPGILILVAFVYIRPQEFVPILNAVPLLYIFLGFAVAGLLVDVRLRRARIEAAPQLLWAVLFILWCVLTLVMRAPSALPELLMAAVSIALFLLIAHGIQTFRALGVLAGLLLACALFLSFVGIHQGLSPYGCHLVDPAAPEVGVYDGRACQESNDCYREDPEPGAEYFCERVGLFTSSSIGDGRVRWLGILMDPNELALALGLALPLAFALFERKRSLARALLVAMSLVMILWCVVYTQSRGGVLVILATLGAYFVRRFGLFGLVAGGLLGAPLLLLGGRSGAEATASAKDRVECLYEGMMMFKDSPLFGVGAGQFIEYHILTAHNSYVLAPAELGFPGMVLWSIVMYLSVKIPATALIRLRAHGPEADVARAWSAGILAALIGLLVGVFFLSFCYHAVLWVYVGLSGALYAALRRHDPGFEVRLETRDLLRVLAIDVALIVGIFLYARWKV